MAEKNIKGADQPKAIKTPKTSRQKLAERHCKQRQEYRERIQADSKARQEKMDRLSGKYLD